MDKLIKWYEKVQQYRARLPQYSKGQTMAEYALILVGVAVVVAAAYTTMGTDLSAFVTKLAGDL
jgi:Flp pilus assembly pilin Flp